MLALLNVPMLPSHLENSQVLFGLRFGQLGRKCGHMVAHQPHFVSLNQPTEEGRGVAEGQTYGTGVTLGKAAMSLCASLAPLQAIYCSSISPFHPDAPLFLPFYVAVCRLQMSKLSTKKHISR